MRSQDIKNHYVYIWFIVDTDEVFYVGKGKNSRYKDTYHRNNEFKSILESNKCDVKIVINYLSNEEACFVETILVNYYRNKGYRLTNKTKGGESGNYNKVWDEEAKEYLRRQRGEKNPNYGHKWSDEMKAKASIRASSSGRYDMAKNPNAKRIKCTETGEEFSCIKEAMLKYAVKCAASFTVALNNPNRTAAGLHWVTTN